MDNPVFQHIMNGDIEAYSGLYKEYYKRFYNYGRKFTTNTHLIEDSIQEVFLDLWNRREKLSHVDSPNFYLYSSFRYVLIKKIRQHDKLVLNPSAEEDYEMSIENVIVSKELNEELQVKLQKAIKTLTGRQLEAIFLKFYENLSYQEVASILNISVKATYKIMARSLLALKEKVMILLLLCQYLLSELF
ncbi:RNA polymerase sigma factor (sigma-70 family) [Chitinophaga dinghuensis]|uniref:RNA polymerase sigma factor (Sigma-70 family) n=1 Tax=Chitinophaga dinghuensis TaxID=1539050 RepID=A0A327VRT7_9BACT|nr:sigma-70 family RNA polymerase sigma factor [Chitinophaga dinghuensis]RAJ76789.1 RNA polymerase sigma factor (sigma-70 family) [Chitinophaga dinghuensis]